MTKKKEVPSALPELSKSEWVIVKICWEHRRATARKIYEEAVRKRAWEYQTVKTMLDRLVAKGYLRCEKLGPLCLFDPVVGRSRAVGEAIKSFADTVLDNAAGPLMVHLAKRGKLSSKEIAELKRLIEKHEETSE